MQIINNRQFENSGTNLVYYFTEQNTGYGSEEYLYDYQYNSYQSYLINISTQDRVVYAAATESGKPEFNIVKKGVNTVSIRARKSSGSDDVTLYARICLVADYMGTHTVTVISTSESTPILTGTATNYTLQCLIPDDVVIPSGSRLLIQVLGNYIGVATDAIVEFIIGLTALAGSTIFTGITVNTSYIPHLRLNSTATQTVDSPLTLDGAVSASERIVSASTYSYEGISSAPIQVGGTPGLVTIVSNFPTEDGSYIGHLIELTGGGNYRNSSIIYKRTAGTTIIVAIDPGNSKLTFVYNSPNLQVQNTDTVNAITFYWSVTRFYKA